jgi:hypothetical protein
MTRRTPYAAAPSAEQGVRRMKGVDFVRGGFRVPRAFFTRHASAIHLREDHRGA